MAVHSIPHLHNDQGASVIHIGAKEFMCVGATAPFDHPHVYLDMGSDNEIICPYCSTHYRFRSDLHADQSDPKGCVLTEADLNKAA
jgi:uncharacterized Zn-finger protein